MVWIVNELLKVDKPHRWMIIREILWNINVFWSWYLNIYALVCAFSMNGNWEEKIRKLMKEFAKSFLFAHPSYQQILLISSYLCQLLSNAILLFISLQKSRLALEENRINIHTICWIYYIRLSYRILLLRRFINKN